MLANWYWFVLSVVVCAGAAFLYLKWAPKVYTRTASVLIKDDAKGGAMSESAAFEDLGLFGTKRNVDNEVLVFKSRRLMTEVARNLHLDVSYTVKTGCGRWNCTLSHPYSSLSRMRKRHRLFR